MDDTHHNHPPKHTVSPERRPIDSIYIVGPASTGKTTLCRALAERLDLESEAWIQEVARTVMERTGNSIRKTIGLMEMQAAILVAQVEREREVRTALQETSEMSERSSPVTRKPGQRARGTDSRSTSNDDRRILLSDRSALDAIVYAQLFSPTPTVAATRRIKLCGHPELQEVLAKYRCPSSRFFLLRPIAEWVVDDGVRSVEDQERCEAVFVETMEQLGVPYEVIGEETKDLDERVERVLDAVGWSTCGHWGVSIS